MRRKLLLTIKVVMEFCIVIGMAQLGAMGDAEKTAQGNFGWMVGFVMGGLAVYSVERLTGGF